MEIKEEKNRLRQEIKNGIKNLEPEYCRQADEAIRRNLWGTRAYQEAKTIFCYVGTSQEIHTVPILMDALEKGKRVGVPKCTSPGVMEVRQIRRMEDLEPGVYGIQEPGMHCPVLAPEELDLVVAPCLSCDRDGGRLGYGGGYYDRYLRDVDAPRAVLCRDRVVQKAIPKEPHDLQMDLVVTEFEVIFC